MTDPTKPDDPEGVGDILFRDEDGGEIGKNGELKPNPDWIARVEQALEDKPASDDPEKTARIETPPYPFSNSPRLVVPSPPESTRSIGSRIWNVLTTPLPSTPVGRIIDGAMDSFYRQLGVDPNETNPEPAWISGLKERHAASRQRREQARSAQQELPLERLVGAAHSNSLETRNYYVNHTARVFAVADGDGFARDVAQAIALETAERVADYVRGQTCQNPGIFYNEAERAKLQSVIEVEIENANARVWKKAHGPKHPELKGMSASLTLAVIAGNYLFTANVGSGRAYHVMSANKIAKGNDSGRLSLAPEQVTDDTEHRLGREEHLRAGCSVQPLNGDVLLTSPAAYYLTPMDLKEACGQVFWAKTGRMGQRLTISYEANPQDIAGHISDSLTHPLESTNPQKPAVVGTHAFERAYVQPALKDAVRNHVPQLREASDERVEEYIQREKIMLTADELASLTDEFIERYGGLDHAVVYVRAQPTTGAKIGARISRLKKNSRIPVTYLRETYSPIEHVPAPVNVAGAEASARIRYLSRELDEATRTGTDAAARAALLEETLDTYTANPDGAVAQQQRIAKLRTELAVAQGDFARESRNVEERYRADLEKAVGVANGAAEEQRKALETRIAAAETAQRTADRQAGNWQDALGLVMHYFEPSNATNLARLKEDAAERWGKQSPAYHGLKRVITGIGNHLQSVYENLEQLARLQRATNDKLGEKKAEIERLRKTAESEQAEGATFVHKVVGYLVNKAEAGVVHEDAKLYRTARRDGFADALDAVASFLNAYHERITTAQESETARLAAEGKYEGLEERAHGEKEEVVREREEARSEAKELGTRLREYIDTCGAVIGALNNVARYLASPPQEGAVVDFHSDVLRERAVMVEGTDTNLYKLLTAMADVMEGVGGIAQSAQEKEEERKLNREFRNASLLTRQYLPNQEQERFVRGTRAYYGEDYQQAEHELEIFKGKENGGVDDPVGMYFLALTVRTQNMDKDEKPQSPDRHEWYKWLMWKAHELEPRISEEMARYISKEKIPAPEWGK